MSDPDYERKVIEEPATVRREEVRLAPREGSNAGWWIAALVAVIAIVALAVVYTNNRATDTNLQAARDTGRAEAMMDSATQQAQVAATTASQASRDAADRAASATQSAADDARAATDRAASATQNAAANAGDAARDAAARADQAPAPEPAPQ